MEGRDYSFIEGMIADSPRFTGVGDESENTFVSDMIADALQRQIGMQGLIDMQGWMIPRHYYEPRIHNSEESIRSGLSVATNPLIRKLEGRLHDYIRKRYQPTYIPEPERVGKTLIHKDVGDFVRPPEPLYRNIHEYKRVQQMMKEGRRGSYKFPVGTRLRQALGKFAVPTPVSTAMFAADAVKMYSDYEDAQEKRPRSDYGSSRNHIGLQIMRNLGGRY